MHSVAIVTGSSSGLGKCLVDDLLAKNWVVIGVTRQATLPNAFTPGGYFHHVQGSVAEQSTVDEAFDCAERLGRARLLINCAGQGCFGEAGSYSASDIKATLEGNLAGLMAFSEGAVRHMGDSGGDIVNIMSTAAKKLRPTELVYAASKWGAKAYSRALRDALKVKHPNIRIFEVYPCGMNTSFWKSAIRPIADGKSFPNPSQIAAVILSAILENHESYQQEITFERS